MPLLLPRLLACLSLLGITITHAQTDTGGRGKSFLPDYTFTDSTLATCTPSGDATWQSRDGELTATLKPGAKGGYLLLDRSYQDTALHTLFHCGAETEVGFLFRMEPTDTGAKGVMVSVKNGEVTSHAITFSKDGTETSRQPLRPAGSIVRQAPPPKPEGDLPRKPRQSNKQDASPLPMRRPDTSFKPGEWNQIEVALDLDIIRAFLNDSGETAGGAADESFGRYGPPALFVSGGTGEVKFKEITCKDLGARQTPKEETSARFHVQRVSDMYYSWGAGAGDFNKDGITDIVAGPYIYYGPHYTGYREIYPAFAFNPSREFTDVNCQYSFDFNGDGWLDIFTGPPRATIYLNPKGEPRRWDKYEVIPSVQTEITVYQDIDGSGVPALIYGADGTLRYAKPDPTDPTKPWVPHIISEPGVSMGHGIGAGDINGDGRPDIINPNGWWEQPPVGTADGPWKYHPQAFARFGHRSSSAGGAVMAIYDVNGDKLNDVVTSLNAHGFGLAWYEQKRTGDGEISFAMHLIADDFSTENPGGVTFSQIHGTTAADIDGDGIPDFIAGKRGGAHLDNQFDPDAWGAPVLYAYRTVRNPAAPGGAEFVPELIHNRSGAGSDVLARDINGDGAVDVVTSTNRGTFIFWNTPAKR